MARSDKTISSINVQGKRIRVDDPHSVQPVCADVIVEFRKYAGTLAISFGSVIAPPGVGEDNNLQAQVCARLRLNSAVALNLCNLLHQALKQTLPPKNERH